MRVETLISPDNNIEINARNEVNCHKEIIHRRNAIIERVN